MLRAGLMREQHHFLGAAALGVDIGNDLQTGVPQVVQTEICNLHVRLFRIRQDDVGFFIHFERLRAGFLVHSFFHDKDSFPKL